MKIRNIVQTQCNYAVVSEKIFDVCAQKRAINHLSLQISYHFLLIGKKITTLVFQGLQANDMSSTNNTFLIQSQTDFSKKNRAQI